MLRLVTALAIVCTLSHAAVAEPTLAIPASLLDRGMDPTARGLLAYSVQQQLDTARGIRNGGIATTVVGMVFSVVGVSLFARSMTCHGCDGQYLAGGITLTSLGPIAVVIGAPIWAAGQHRVNRAERAKLALSASGLRVSF